MFALECYWCGLIAFRFKEKPVWGQVVCTTDVVLKDGSVPLVGSPMQCQECGGVVPMAALDPSYLVSVDN